MPLRPQGLFISSTNTINPLNQPLMPGTKYAINILLAMHLQHYIDAWQS
jgi:hypothetical protein